jgi:hypothetical protein
LGCAHTPLDVKLAVQQMRLAAAAKRIGKHRSWAAAFSLNKKSSRTPKFDRFASPVSDIRGAVEEMRLDAAAKRASKLKSWAAAYELSQRKAAGCANPPQNIMAAVADMRIAASSKRASKQRSWAATFALNKLAAKKPAFERFADPCDNIRTAVEEMRKVGASKRASKHRSWSAVFPFGPCQTAGCARTPVDVWVAVQQMRFAAASKRAGKHRSWAAAYSLNKKSSRTAKFERFASPACDIRAAVQEMRSDVAAKRASKLKSWAATYELSPPKAAGCANPARDIQTVVAEMRMVAVSKRAGRTRSWAAEFSINKLSTKKPALERFASPANIRSAVEEMRRSAQAKHAAKHRSWTAAFSFNQLSSKAPNFKRFSSRCDIRAAVEDMRVAAAYERANKQRSWAAMFSLNKINSRKPKFQRFASPPSDIKAAVEAMRLAGSARRETKAEASAKEEEMRAADVEALILEEEIRELSVKLEAAREAQENDELIAEELNDASTITPKSEVSSSYSSQYTKLSMPIKQASETGSPGPLTTYLVGSPAAAMRQLRRSAATFRMDAGDEEPSRAVGESSLTRAYSAIGAQFFSLDDGEDGPSDQTSNRPNQSKRAAPGGAARSAMEVDLDCGRVASSPCAREEFQQPSWMKVSKSTPSFIALKPLVGTKSTSFMQAFVSTKPNGKANKYAGDVSAWRVC